MGSGPAVARLFQRLLAIVFVAAWASLGSQVLVLMGSRGLLPVTDFAQSLRTRDVAFSDVPSFLRFYPSDGALMTGVWAGVALGSCAFFGILPRITLALSTLLYLSYTVAARDFLSFQWDNLLLECGALSVLLPANRRAPFAHFLLRVALFKLYFESGIAKYQSHLGDWKDGSAMAYYYETAPIPTWLAWYAHRLPAFWHKLESWATLAFEIVCPVLIFFPRTGRLFAFSVFTVFQVVNIATANYGFFSYLALFLGVFLLDDTDLHRARRAILSQVLALARRATDRGRRLRRLRARIRLAGRGFRRFEAQAANVLRRPFRSSLARVEPFAMRFLAPEPGSLPAKARAGLAAVPIALYVGISAEEAVENFWRDGPRSETLATLVRTVAPFRIVNTYHLFGSITRERIEPTFETRSSGDWTEHDFYFKPGNIRRPPPIVAPHQPRIDFLLWFYGLSYERGMPRYVQTLLLRMCTQPDAVAALFVRPLPEHPVAARVSFYSYRFTSAEERRETKAYWKRENVGSPRGMRCR
jgi:lipase maturation factor 1